MAFFLLVFLSFFASWATALDPIYHWCDTSENFTNNSIYSSNLKVLLSTLSSNASATGFSTFTTGNIPDSIYGLTFCRGDIENVNCSSCISTALSDIQKLCLYNKEGAIWYEYCQLRYSSQDFLHDPDVTNGHRYLLFMSPNNVSANQLSSFETLTTSLMENVSDLAVRNTSRFFATGEAALTATDIIYGQVQCALGMSANDCHACLQLIVSTIKDYLKGRRGGMVFGMAMWCNMR